MGRPNPPPLSSEKHVRSAASPCHAEEKFLGIFSIPETINSIVFAFFLTAGIMSLFLAFTIRTIAIKQFGTVIHEFDPWFNYRTAQYIHENGWKKFLDWYDYQSWYPFGRPVGSTTYPGLQLTAVAIHVLLGYLGNGMSLNDVCCYIPAWFGCISTLLVGLLAYECSQSQSSAVLAAIIMAVIPSHIVRTVGGGFDNESVAIPAMCAVFYCWTRCHRNRMHGKVLFGILAGLSYGYMVVTWGGFVYVTNIIALHTGVLLVWDWLRGQYNVDLYQCYSIYFVIGTAIATRVAPVGSMPFQSIEQISGLLVFLGMQILQLSELHRRKKGIHEVWSRDCFLLRLKYILFSAIGGISIFLLLDRHGFFGPLTARVRSLIIQHTSTGNPLVDSVAEHQPMSVEGLWIYSSYAFYFTPVGAIIAACNERSRQTFFLLLNLIISWHFAMKMSRLIIFSSIPCAVFSGIFLGKMLDNSWKYLIWHDPISLLSSKNRISRIRCMRWYTRIPFSKFPRILFSVLIMTSMYFMLSHADLFFDHCWDSSVAHSQPQIVFYHYDGGKHVLIDDYRDSYMWLREHTPEDSRVLAWWDYGYHITGIANRTSLADGNTWNHEHIALIGKCLCSPIEETHGIIRHLADYVLLWTGGGADCIAKSPWVAKISNSVYNDICPNDPLCTGFRFMADGSPSPLMEKSTMYALQKYGETKGACPLTGLFEKVYDSRNRLVSIYKVLNVSQESKVWVRKNMQQKQLQHGNRQGTYPPAEELQAVLRRGKPMGN